MKPWPTAIHSEPRPVTRWRITYADGTVRVVMATDSDAAQRAAAFFSFEAVTSVDVVG